MAGDTGDQKKKKKKEGRIQYLMLELAYHMKKNLISDSLPHGPK